MEISFPGTVPTKNSAERVFVETPSPDHPLCNVRNLLLPGIYGKAEKNIELEIIVDFSLEGLICRAYNSKLKKTLGFAIMGESIKDGSYKRQFAPSLEALLNAIR